MISIGADISFEHGNLSVSAMLCGLKIQILPKKESSGGAKKEKAPKVKRKDEPTEEKPEISKEKKKLNLNFSFDEIMSILKKVLKGLGKFGRFKVSRFYLDYIASGDDPYEAARSFGYINAALSTLIPVADNHFKVKDFYVHTDLDLSLEKTYLDFGTAFSIRIGQILGAVNTIIFGAAGILIKNKIRLLFERIRTPASEKV